LVVTALDRNDSHEIATGVLKVVDNQIDASTGTFKLKSEFANANNALWPGQFVNVRVKVKTISGGVVVPATAVQRGPDGSYAYVVQPDNTVAMQALQVGDQASDSSVLITSGLKVGDKVVTEGQFRLKPGSTVQPLAPGEAGPATSAEELAKIKDAAPKQQAQRRRPGSGG
ncbi:MAG: efflux RND transporter periplasmic adaptor subunit, partial [Rhodanobacteraceae bacterium]